LRFMNFSRSDGPAVHLGCELGEHCLDVTGAISAGHIQCSDVSSIEDALRLEGGIGTLEQQLHGLSGALSGVGDELLLPTAGLRLRQPIFSPQKIIGIGLNYHDHADEVAMTKPEQPLLFAMFANTIIGPEESIVIPEMSDQIDFEAEMGVVIGQRGRHIPLEKAIEHVAGYTIVNDVSARDLQFSDNQWIRGKSIDTFAPMGPCLVTTSDLGDGNDLRISLRLNGETMQDSNTSNLIFKVAELVSYTSRVLTLEPGDVIATGTPAGVGFTRKPPVFMKPGDVVEIDLEGVGTLKNLVSR